MTGCSSRILQLLSITGRLVNIMRENSENLQTSILDKLIDNEPQNSSESVASRMVSLRDIEASVIRDIENLLNTRRTIHIPSAILNEVNKSLYMYGLRDFTAENPSSSLVVQKLRREISQTLALFEPRLKGVVVHIKKSGNGRDLHFRIAGTLVINPISEPVIFDIHLDPNRGDYRISR
jgi:type VI secretion system protein ImpF